MSSNGGSSDVYFSTDPDRCITSPRVTLTIDYDSTSIKPSASPEELYEKILSKGSETGFILHSKDCGTEWKNLAFDVLYNETDTNTLHLIICIGWPSCQAKEDNAKKIKLCVKNCVKDAFDINIDEGVGSMVFDCPGDEKCP